MKFSLNGALTIGTLDGANVEIREAVGSENFFLFGLTVDRLQRLYNEGYIPYTFYENNGELRTVLDLVRDGYFSHGDANLFKPLCDHLLYHDDYFVMADYESYLQCQQKAARAWLSPDRWARMSIINTCLLYTSPSPRD